MLKCLIEHVKYLCNLASIFLYLNECGEEYWRSVTVTQRIVLLKIVLLSAY